MRRPARTGRRFKVLKATREQEASLANLVFLWLDGGLQEIQNETMCDRGATPCPPDSFNWAPSREQGTRSRRAIKRKRERAVSSVHSPARSFLAATKSLTMINSSPGQGIGAHPSFTARPASQKNDNAAMPENPPKLRSVPPSRAPGAKDCGRPNPGRICTQRTRYSRCRASSCLITVPGRAQLKVIQLGDSKGIARAALT